MSLESFMRYHGDAVRVRDDALRIFNRISEERARTEEMLEQEIEQTFQFKFPETECVIRMLTGEWGIYGVGAAYLADEDVGDQRVGVESPVIAPALLLDPLWLVRDLDRLDARAPQVWAWQAEWARPRIEELLGHMPLDGFVFQTSARPRPFAVAPGGETEFTDINEGVRDAPCGPGRTMCEPPSSPSSPPETSFIGTRHPRPTRQCQRSAGRSSERSVRRSPGGHVPIASATT